MKSPADFKNMMPYASELFGISQPLQRWKFRMIANRFEKFRNTLFPNRSDQTRTSQCAERQAGADLATDTGRHDAPNTSDLKPIAFVSEVHPPPAATIDCGIARLLQREVGSNPPQEWRRLITTATMATRLEKLKTLVAQPAELENFPDIADYVQSFTQAIGTSDQTLLVQSLFEKEAQISGFLLFLARHKPTQLDELFFTPPQAENRLGGVTIAARTAPHLGQD